MTKREREQRDYMQGRIEALGFSRAEFGQLRRISMTLSRWGERECGDGSDWAIERDDSYRIDCPACSQKSWPAIPVEGKTCVCPKCGHTSANVHTPTGKPFLVYHGEGKARRIPIADREAGALKRLTAIVARHPNAVAYHQPDCRGAAVYIVPKERVTGSLDSCYTNGIAVY